MEPLVSLLVGKPLNIVGVALVFLCLHLVVYYKRRFSARHPRALLVVAAVWTLYAAWEALVRAFTPEANIRVDLLLLWPMLLVISVWFTVRALR